jgi:hypothetical protein
MKAISTEYYGDETRWFMGEVKSTSDPDKLGRLRVRIFGLHTGDTSKIKDTDLPWANVVLPVTQGGTSNTTQPTGIQKGAKVFGIFVDGKQSQVPLVLGSIPHNPTFRVKFDGPTDAFVSPTSAKLIPQHKAGDKITASIGKRLLDSGVDPGKVGTPLTQTQATALNGVVAGSGNIKADLIGQGRQEQTYNFLKEYFQKRGHNNPGFVAAAFVGNFMNESYANLDPSSGEKNPLIPNSRGGFGIAQWTGARRVELENFAAQHNADVANLVLQLNWTTHELDSTMNYVYKYLQQDQTIESATETIFANYENPDVVLKFRGQNAEMKPYGTYQRAGGIYNFVRKSSQQSETIRLYKLEYEERLSAAKDVYNAYGG